jgi:hypothetical protein
MSALEIPLGKHLPPWHLFGQLTFSPTAIKMPKRLEKTVLNALEFIE